MVRESSSKRKRTMLSSSPTPKNKRPTTAYHFFMKEEIMKFKEQNPNTKVTQSVRSVLDKQWRKLPEDEKAIFNKKFETSQKGYNRKKKKLELATGKTKSIQTRLSLSKIVALNEKLTEEQQDAVRDIGLGSLLHLKCTMLKHQLCRWLIDRFDPVNMTLEIHEKMIKVTPEDVERVLSLVNKGKIIPTNGDEKEIVELERLFVVQDTVIPLNHLSSKLEKCDSHGHDFKALYCMYVIGYLLYPVIDHVVKKDMLHVVKDRDNLGRYNWAKFVLDSLARGVHTWREKNRKYVSGCVFFLMILFFERVNPRDELDMPHSLRPCIKYWTDNEVSRRLGKYKERGGYSNPDACVVLYPIVEKIES